MHAGQVVSLLDERLTPIDLLMLRVSFFYLGPVRVCVVVVGFLFCFKFFDF